MFGVEFFGIGLGVIVLGLVGYIWKLRKYIVKVLPWVNKDTLDTVEGMADHFGLDVDELAKKSRGKLKNKVQEKLKE